MLASLDQHAYNFGVEKDQDRHLVSPNPSRVGKLRIANVANPRQVIGATASTA
jgi:hypothetical protein